MPVRRFTSIQEAEDAYADLERENIELRAASKHTVGGFLSRNEKLVIGVVSAILMLIGGGAFTTGLLNREQIKEAKDTQQEIKVTTEATANKVDDAAVKVQDVDNKVVEVHREVKKKKGPFGE